MPLPRSFVFSPVRSMRAGSSLVLACVASAGLACGPSSAPASSAANGAMLSCPAPIGAVPKEDCAEIADDFGALTVQGAIPHAGAGRDAEIRLDAIRSVDTLARSIKDQRVKLCQAYVACKVPRAEHDARDQLLTGAMKSLIEAWNQRRLSSREEVQHFRDTVRSIDQRVNGAPPPPPPPRAPRTFKADEALARIEDPGVAFRIDQGSLAVSASADGKRDALRSKPDALSLPAGGRYRIKVSGTYKPATAPLVQPGDELIARLKYRAAQPADLTIALRSLEDPDASEASESFHATPGDAGAHETKLTADPQQTGFYLGVAVRGAPVDLDDVELVRAGAVITAARAEGVEPGVKTDCALLKQKPLAGKQSLRCQAGEGDRITLGQPQGYLVISVRDASGERASTRTLSLEGGRSVDAAVGADARLVITLVGAGSATVERIEITDLGGS